MIPYYAFLYQYFDARERELKELLDNLYNLRRKTVADLQEIVYAEVKLEYLKKIENEILKWFSDVL